MLNGKLDGGDSPRKCQLIMRKIFRLAYELFSSGAFGGSIRVSRKEAQGGGCRFGDGQIFRTRAEKLCYNTEQTI